MLNVVFTEVPLVSLFGILFIIQRQKNAGVDITHTTVAPAQTPWKRNCHIWAILNEQTRLALTLVEKEMH